MISLNPEHKKYILSTRQGSIVIDGKKYWFKPDYENFSVLGYEQLIEFLAEKVNIKCAHYELVDIDGIYYTISEDIGANFTLASDMGIPERTSLYDIWYQLEKAGVQNIYELMQEIVKMYLFDIFIINGDRRSKNYGFVENSDGLLHLCILDNSFCFDREYSVHISSKLGETQKNKNYVFSKIVMSKNTEDLIYFLKTSSKEYIDIFMDMYNTLTPTLLKEAMLSVTATNKKRMLHLKYITRLYEKNYKTIGKAMEEHLDSRRSL